MSVIVFSSDWMKRMPELSQRLEVRDDSGQLLGHFVPLRAKEPPLSKEELQRRLNEPEFSTEEVLKHLESL